MNGPSFLHFQVPEKMQDRTIIHKVSTHLLKYKENDSNLGFRLSATQAKKRWRAVLALGLVLPG